MLLSHAVMTGSTLKKLTSCFYLDNECACLMGMGFVAAGLGSTSGNWSFEKLYAQWPWLKEEVPDPRQPGHTTLPKFVINWWAVEVRLGLATLEQAVDWIRSVEPAEPQTKEQFATMLEEVFA
jgi:hypothetical protein